MADPELSSVGDFRLGDWLVQPNLNRISRGDSTITLELKVMQVLVCLAEHEGDLVTRQELTDSVWATEFISDNTVTHAITELRNALGDDATSPTYVETIHRKGYRLIAPVESVGGEDDFGNARPAIGKPRWPYVLVIGTAALTLIMWIAFRPELGPPAQTVAVDPALDRSLLVIVPFENRTGDPGFDALGVLVAGRIGDGLRGQTIDYLIASLGVEITEPTVARDTSSLIALASNHGAGTLLSGSLSRSGGSLRFEARVTDAMQHRAGPAIEPVMARLDNLEEGLEELRQRAMALVWWYRSTAHTLLSTPKPPRWEALEVHLAAPATVDGLPGFRQALQLDPDYHAVWYAISVIYSNFGMWQEAIEALDELDAQPEKLTPYGRHMSAAFRAGLNGQNSTERHHLLRAREVEPRADVRRKLAVTAMALGRPREAVVLLSERLAENPKVAPPGVRYFAQLADAFFMLGQYEQMVEIARRGRVAFPDSAWVVSEEACGLAALGRLEELDRLIDECRTVQYSDPEGAGFIMSRAVEVLRSHGHPGDALTLARRAVEWHRGRAPVASSSWRRRLFFSDAIYNAEEWDEARHQYLELADEVGDIKPVLRYEDARPMSVYGRLGVVAARLGDGKEAERISALLQDVEGFTWGEPSFYQALIAAQLGRTGRALQLLRQALADGLSVGDLLWKSSEFESLWDNPEFQELVRPKG